MAPLTRPYIATIRERASHDAGFRRALLREALDCLLAGDVGTSKVVIRDYINATTGFEPISAATGIPAKSLMRMLSAGGNPIATNLMAVIQHLQATEGVSFRTAKAVVVRSGRLPSLVRATPATRVNAGGIAPRPQPRERIAAAATQTIRARRKPARSV